MFFRMTEVYRGIKALYSKITLVKVKVTIGHKGQNVGPNLEFTSFQHLPLLKYSVIRMESHLD